MIRPIRTAQPASDELTEAVGWYERQRAGLGEEFFEAILLGFPYQVVYRVGADEIRILAFAHLKRRPGFWRRRR